MFFHFESSPNCLGSLEEDCMGWDHYQQVHKNKTTIGKPPQLHSLAEKQITAACLSVDHTGYM